MKIIFLTKIYAKINFTQKTFVHLNLWEIMLTSTLKSLALLDIYRMTLRMCDKYAMNTL